MSAPDQTNAEVSDERVREIEPCPFCGKELEFSENLSIHGGGWMHHGDEAERDRPCFLIGKIIYNTPGDLERWNRRSVTSQASEGEWRLVPIEPTGMMLDALGLDINNGSELWSLMLASAPLASPSKRVERLETALKEVRQRARNARGAIESNQVVDKDVHGSMNWIMEQIDQALQGGRS